MSQAIITKYYGPTNNRGARVRAWCQAGSMFVPWDDALDVDGNHDRAAHRLATQFGWLERKGSKLIGGGLPDGTGNAYVISNRVPSLVPEDCDDSEETDPSIPPHGDTLKGLGKINPWGDTQKSPIARVRLQ